MHDDMDIFFATMRSRELLVLLMMALIGLGFLTLAGLVVRWNQLQNGLVGPTPAPRASAPPMAGVRGESMQRASRFDPEETIPAGRRLNPRADNRHSGLRYANSR